MGLSRMPDIEYCFSFYQIIENFGEFVVFLITCQLSLSIVKLKLDSSICQNNQYYYKLKMWNLVVHCFV